MRLLNAETLEIEEFFGDAVPAYVILSHTWEAGEVSYREMYSFSSRTKAGYSKIERCCQLASQNGFHWVWIDTCCIDKPSSAELAEAINSMFSRYKKAAICYAYLVDVGDNMAENATEFSTSRWFTRGWTLQELIAPDKVVFFSNNWIEIGTKESMSEVLEITTGIRQAILLDGSLHNVSIAQRMSWAARRVTTRIEDIAYSLLGIFGVNMPLLYGEGDKAFTRLQEEILRNSDDESLFAWKASEEISYTGDIPLRGLLARSPSEFIGCERVVPLPRSRFQEPYSMTNKGLRILFSLIQENPEDDPHNYIAILGCRIEDNFRGPIAIFLHRIDMLDVQFSRRADKPPIILSSKAMLHNNIDAQGFQNRIIYVKSNPTFSNGGGKARFHIRTVPPEFRITDACPGGVEWS